MSKQMIQHSMKCLDPQRRRDLLLAGTNGIDSVHVIQADRKTLRVVLLRPWPPDDVKLRDAAKYFRIEGGRRTCNLRVIRVAIPSDVRRADPFGLLDVTLDCAGDDSAYVLRMVNPRNPDQPPSGFDLQFCSAEFRFRPTTVAEHDCGPNECPPSMPPLGPPIDYLAKDYASFRRLMLDRLAQTIPDWTERNVADLGIALVEVMAYTADHLSYHQDAVATEAYLDTARRRISVRRHCRLVDYRMHEGCNARAWLHIEVDGSVTEKLSLAGLTFFTESDDPTRQRGPRQIRQKSKLEQPEEFDRIVFEPVVRADSTNVVEELYASHNEIHFYTWGDRECCLPKGATSATLECNDEWSGENGPVPSPKVGDLMLFEEVKGPRTGLSADADSRHRHVVRLTRVEKSIDHRPVFVDDDAVANPLPNAESRAREQNANKPQAPAVIRTSTIQDIPVLAIEWDVADALPFSLCISTRNQIKVSVARGNIVLVDHGLTIDEKAIHFGELPASDSTELSVCGAGGPYLGADPPLGRPIRFYTCRFPWQLVRSLTHAAPFPNETIQARTQARGLARWLGEVQDKRKRRQIRQSSEGPNVRELEEPRQEFRNSSNEPAQAIDPLRLVDDWLRLTRSGMPITGREIAELNALQMNWHKADSDTPEMIPDFLCPAIEDLRPDPRQAIPRFWLTEELITDPNEAASQDGLANRAQDRALIQWEARSDLLASGPEDRHFVIEIDDQGFLMLRFGDGRHGRAPEPGTKFRVKYRIGNGLTGNVGAEAIRGVVGENSGAVLAVRNPLAALGGIDPESLATAKMLAPHAFRTKQLRAITAEDYARLAENDERVQRAAAELAWTGTGFEAQVALDIRAAALAQTDNPAAEEKLIRDEVEIQLNHYRRIGHDVRVVPVHEVPLLIHLRICLEPHVQRGRVRTAIEATLSNRDLPDGSRGFFHPDNLTFGTGIDLSVVVARVQAVEGIAAVDVLEFRRMFGSSGRTLINGTLPMGPLEIARLDNDPIFREHGELTLELKGGR